jgi:cytochrome c-type biogenesis protein
VTPLDPLLLAPAAFLAGILMFLAPCTLPIVPGYLAFIAGGQGRVVRNAAAFVLGFSVIFILLGAFAGFLGAFIGPWRPLLGQTAGVILIIFGLVMLGVRIPFLSGQKNIGIPKWLSVGSPFSSMLIGALFALGWSPCIGPVLGTVLLFASTSSTMIQGAVLLGIFSLGLGLPFLLTALVLEKAQAAFQRWGKFTTTLSKVGGLILIALGVLMIIGRMDLLLAWGFELLDSFYDRLWPYM